VQEAFSEQKVQMAVRSGADACSQMLKMLFSAGNCKSYRFKTE